MKFSKFIIPAIVSSMILGAVTTSYAGSIGRSSSSSSSSRSSSSSSMSRPSTPSAPSKSSAAPAPSQTGGIGGQSSMGVRKSEVTAPVAQKVEQKRPQPTQASPGSTTPGSPAYSTAPQPNYAPAQSPGLGAGGVFMSSLGGSLAGNLLANSLFGNHGSSGTTVVNNNGGGGGVPVAQNGPSANGSSSFDQGSQSMPVKKSYGIGDFIMDIILFALLIGVLVCIVWVFYKGYKMIRDYVNKERGTGTKQPFSPTAQFWLIQNAFATADIALLKTLLGPDLVDEATRDLEASSLSLKNVSHEVVLDNASEFSVHYTFNDGDIVVDQVWHYEQHAKSWKLNGIETV